MMCSVFAKLTHKTAFVAPRAFLMCRVPCPPCPTHSIPACLIRLDLAQIGVVGGSDLVKINEQLDGQGALAFAIVAHPWCAGGVGVSQLQ